VTEALQEIMAHGLAGMSLRKVAAALETGPASLYAYVEDLEELHALVLDRALAAVKLGGSTKATWRERLQRVLESYARVLAAGPGLAELAMGTVAVGPNALRITETLLALLEEGGVTLATGAWAVDLLVLYVTAIVAEHANGLDPAAPDGIVARAIAGASERDYPRVHAARAHLLAGSPDERFKWALDVLLRGIVQLPPAAGRAPAGAARSKTRARKKPSRRR
jgi:AcrR family transcriptional regulator